VRDVHVAVPPDRGTDSRTRKEFHACHKLRLPARRGLFLPSAIAATTGPRLQKSHFVLNLGTKEQPKARRLAGRLNAQAGFVFDTALANPAIDLGQLKQSFRRSSFIDLNTNTDEG
jgi:hypothetical protein